MLKSTKSIRSIGLLAASALTVSLINVLPALASTRTIQAGDTFYTLSQSTGIPVASWKSANPNLNPINLQIGATLNVPGTSANRTYVVQKGDTPWTIAHKEHVSWSSLLAENPSIQPNNLQVGTDLKLPASSSVSAPTTRPTSSNPAQISTGQNLYWMERVINAEAGGEPLKAQVAVGDVVLHRMLKDNLANVHDVVFQVISGHYQFTSVSNGYIYTAPQKSSIQAAKDVLQQHQDVVPGALVFYNPVYTPSNSWVRTQHYITSIGALVFAK